MTAYEIPLTPKAQNFAIALAGQNYRVALRWNGEASAWVMDLLTESGDPVVAGVALTTGVDLIGQYAYLGIGGSLYVQTDHDKHAMPTKSNLGETSHVYFVVP